MNTPYTTPTGLQIGSMHFAKQAPSEISNDEVKLQRALLATPKRTCNELGVCQACVPACQGCTYKPKDSWEALCRWLVRRFG